MDAEIKAVMRALGNSVENALRAIDVRCRRVHRGSEVAVPFAFWRDLVEVLFFDLVGIGNLFDLFGVGLGELPVHRELNLDLRIIREPDRKHARESHECLCGGRSRQFEFVLAGFDIEAHSCQREPGFTGRLVAEGEWMSKPASGERFDRDGAFTLNRTGAPFTSFGGWAWTVQEQRRPAKLRKQTKAAARGIRDRSRLASLRRDSPRRSGCLHLSINSFQQRSIFSDCGSYNAPTCASECLPGRREVEGQA